MSRRSLAGRRVLVTGGSSGIGLATAVLLVREGARVAIVTAGDLRYDAIVVGAGPNALSAAITLAPAGRATLPSRRRTARAGRCAPRS